MKKLILLVAVLALLGAACKTDTTVDADTAADPVASSDENTDSQAAAGAEGDGDESATAVVEPTNVPAATTAPAGSTPTAAPETDDDPASSTATTEPAAAPTATPVPKPYEPTTEQLASIKAVTDADNWCQAAAAVEAGTAALDDLNFNDPAELEAGFRTSVAVITASRRLAPPLIADDVDQAIEAFTGLGVALEDAQWSFLDVDLGVIDQYDAPMELATYNIELYNFTDCGIGTDPGAPPTQDPGSSTTSPLPSEGTVREQAIAGLVQAGFSEEEAACVLSKLDLSDPEAFTDTAAVFSVFTECGISLDRLAQLGG